MEQNSVSSVNRIRFIYISLIIIVVILGLRLFYLQILRSDYYQNIALSSQLKQYEIPAERGGIYAFDGNEIVPVVLNEVRYRIVADPELVDDPQSSAKSLSNVLKIPQQEILTKLESNTRYEILANKQTKEVRDQINDLSLPGIFTNEKTPQRVYIQGQIAPQVLGFVNDAGAGNYGVEQFLNDELSGTPGRVKALTDQNNIPLLATSENTLIDPIDGKDLVLTLDISMQRQAEAILKEGLKNAVSESGSIIIIDPRSGAIKSMATYPTYDPAKFGKVADEGSLGLFINTAVSSPLEPGSIMKVLTAAAALETNSIVKDQTYYDPGYFDLNGSTITNVGSNSGAGNRSVSDILQLSLNTGATWLLMQMGDGEINQKARDTWYDYLRNKYQFGKKTGVEQGETESDQTLGIVPDPQEGFGLDLKYANTAFGQGITVTPLQMASAVSSVVNGGTYYYPRLLSASSTNEGEYAPREPIMSDQKVVSESTSITIREFMENVIKTNNISAYREGYRVGGKTGTAQIANPEGGYYESLFNGTYVGFVGGDMPEYVIMVRVDEPKIPGYAGSQAAAPIFSSIANMLMDNFTVSRVGQ